jgi:hypothetical protein
MRTGSLLWPARSAWRFGCHCDQSEYRERRMHDVVAVVDGDDAEDAVSIEAE